jgi:hypothetical protein
MIKILTLFLNKFKILWGVDHNNAKVGLNSELYSCRFGRMDINIKTPISINQTCNKPRIKIIDRERQMFYVGVYSKGSVRFQIRKFIQSFVNRFKFIFSTNC